MNAAIFQGLNEEQKRAVKATRGPVCILAGAGSGKTTTITRRIANQVAERTFSPGSILAVTFTDKAAAEMRARLHALGVEGVRARTFHSAALAQLRHFSNEPPGAILPSKTVALRQLANSLPKPYRFRPAADLATEIEWAKNRRISPADYQHALGTHEPPIPPDLMASIYKRYENGKRDRGLIDFEDLLEQTIRLFHTGDYVREEFANHYHAFTVDEYQDVNLLQETLLREWLGERDNLCVVGDDYQSIYGFTGATPEYLLDMPARFPGTRVIRLETNYRSTPQVLSAANRLVPKLGGATKVLQAVRDDGARPIIKGFRRSSDELDFIAQWIRTLSDGGVPFEEIAILYRVNFRSEDYEEVLAAQAIPYQVKDGAFLNRATARQMLALLRRSRATTVASDVRRAAERAGFVEELPDGLGEQEITRQNDLARFIRLAEEFDDGTRTGTELAADIEGRFGTEGDGRGVNLMTLHRAKGLEFEAVVLPRLEEGELPFRRARSDEAIAEERRLFYVGLTRAKTYLAVTWVSEGRRKPSPFVVELRRDPAAGPAKAPPRETISATLGLEVTLSGGFTGRIIEADDERATVELGDGGLLVVEYGDAVSAGGRTLPLSRPQKDEASSELVERLKKWRLERSRRDAVPAYVVLHDATLEAIAQREPSSLEELAEIAGLGPVKLERYGDEILNVVGAREVTPADDAGKAEGGLPQETPLTTKSSV